MLSLLKIIHTNYFAFISDVEPARQVEVVFATIDDSEIADEEYMVLRMVMVHALTRNGRRSFKKRKKQRFATMKVEKNGKVMQAEITSAGESRFLEANADKDRKVPPGSSGPFVGIEVPVMRNGKVTSNSVTESSSCYSMSSITTSHSGSTDTLSASRSYCARDLV